jgi:hypothetical protein
MSGASIKKIWEWIKTMVYKIADLIPRRLRRESLEPAPSTPLEKELGKKIQKRQARELGRAVDTRQGGPNMPRRQRCSCGRWAKRKRKTMGGAYYKCPIHGEFFVRASRL